MQDDAFVYVSNVMSFTTFLTYHALATLESFLFLEDLKLFYTKPFASGVLGLSSNVTFS